MFKFIVRALAGLFLTKDARKAVGQIQIKPVGGGGKVKSPFAQRDARGAAPGAQPPVPTQKAATPAEADLLAEVQSKGSEVVTADRAELIRQAMRVRAAKQKILADLDDETRGKLVATAMKALLKQGREDDRA